MIQNVRAYIMDRQEQMQRIVSYISFQRIPGEQPGIFCVSEAAGKNYPGRITGKNYPIRR